MTFDNPLQAFVTADSTAAQRTKAKAKPAKAQRTTKKSRAIELYKANIVAGKAVVIALYKSELNMTDAGSNSYFYAVKKLVSSK